MIMTICTVEFGHAGKRGKAIARLVPVPKDQTGLLEYLAGTGTIVDPNDDLDETFTPEEIAEFERHLMEVADEFLTPPSKKSGRRGQ